MKTKKKISKKRADKNRRWKKENKQLQSMHRNAPALKEFLRVKGCKLPFYDYLDSYSAEFNRIIETAMARHTSLLGVHELADDLFYAPNEEQWRELGYGHLEQLFFDIGDEYSDYLERHTNKNDATLEGNATAFLDADGKLRTVVLIRKALKGGFEHAELKYVAKIGSLCHELGHVDDLEQGINFDLDNRKADIIEAEVYAHLVAFEQLAIRCCRMSYVTLVDSLAAYKGQSGHLGETVDRLFERLPDRRLEDWNDHLDDITPEILAELKPSTRDKLMNLEI